MDAASQAALPALVDRGAWAEICRLSGDFAAVVDEGLRIRLIANRLGSRPLYFWTDGRGRLVASERLAELLDRPGVPRTLDRQGVMELLALGRVGGRRTQYADIKGLAGRTMVTVDATSGASEARLDVLRWADASLGRAAAAERIADALRGAAARMAPAPGEGALLLSGGVDARMVAAALKAAGADGLIARTLATHHEAQERRVAARIAEAAGLPHETLPMLPTALGERLDAAVADSDGLYAAPIYLGAHASDVAAGRRVAFTGHGLDYMLRGMYLPCRTLRIAGSRTRLPVLRPLPDRDAIDAETVQRSLRVDVDLDALAGLLAPAERAGLDARRTRAVAEALNGVEPAHAADAWDGYLLSTQCKHYTYADMIALNRVAEHRCLAYDSEVIDAYLATPAPLRAEERVARNALRLIDPAIAAVTDANTGLRQSIPFPIQIATMTARGAARRAGFFRPATPPHPTMTNGSWPNTPEVLRQDPILRDRIAALLSSPTLLDTGLFDPDGLRAMVQRHLTGRGTPTKTLLMLLTLDCWFDRFGYDGSRDDAR